MTSVGSTIVLLDPADAGGGWVPVSLGVPPGAGEAESGVRNRRLTWPPGLPPRLSAAATLAVVAVVVGRHAGQRRFQIGSDLGSRARIHRIGVDLGADPPIRTVLADAVAAVAAADSRPVDRVSAWRTDEPIMVRHRYGHGAAAHDAEPGVLDIHFHWSGGDLVVDVANDARCVDGRTADLVLEHLTRALLVAGDEASTVSELPLAGDAERRTVAAWGRGATVPQPARTIPELVRAQALRQPSAVAVTGQHGQLTYAELVARAEHLATAFTELGVGPDTIVGVHAERSVDLIPTLLGVLEAGGAYLALDPGHIRPARLAELVTAAGARLVVTDRELRASPVPVMNLAPPAATPARRSSRGHHGDVRALAYVSYTSGSTGVPKGVAVTHEAVARLVRNPGWCSLGPGETMLFLSTVAFDASTLEIWGPLCAGGRVAVYPPGPVRLDELADYLPAAGVTCAWFTAGLFQQLVDAQPAAFAGLRHVFAGGDIVSGEHTRRLLAAHPGLRFTNGYGPTENTTFTTTWSTEGGAPTPKILPIGRPIPGTSVAILDERLVAVPVGVPGELYTGGAGLARGYLHQPALTADRFVPDPTGAVPGGRLYRTGDVARWRPDGQIEFCGRTDAQVKVRGYRVELAEVEAALRGQPQVAEAVVVAEPDGLAVHRLVGYVRLDGPRRGTAQTQAVAAEVRRRLRDALPAYLVPSVVVPLAEFPITSSGKIDRARLATGMLSPRVVEQEYIAPRTDTEARLAAIWASLLRVDPVGVRDNFFDLGGHSLAVSQLIREVEMEFSMTVKARTVFLRPTIASLAEVLTGDFATVRPVSDDRDALR